MVLVYRNNIFCYWHKGIEIIYIYYIYIHISFPWQTGCANMAWLELMLAAPRTNWMLSCSDWRSVACSVKNCWQWFSVLSSFKLDPIGQLWSMVSGRLVDMTLTGSNLFRRDWLGTIGTIWSFNMAMENPL